MVFSFGANQSLALSIFQKAGLLKKRVAGKGTTFPSALRMEQSARQDAVVCFVPNAS
jgi:hypothetical protein